MNNVIEIYCDGGCHNNSSKNKDISIGAYGYIILYKDKYKEFAHAKNNTTNNQQELLAVIESLKILKTINIPIRVYCDSSYVINCGINWINSWIKNNWKTSSGKSVKNKELIEELYFQIQRFDDIEFIQVKGHSGNKYNDLVDKLCTDAIERYKLDNKEID